MASIISRFWMLGHPAEIVFDEVYFGNFTNFYIKETFFFDIHPPFGKMLMAFIAYLAEYDGSIDFNAEYSYHYQSEDYLILRSIPAFFGGLCPPLIYLTARFGGFNFSASLVSAVYVMLDTISLTQHRFILSDAILHFFSCLFLAIYSYTLTLPEYSTKWIIMEIVSGLALGACGSCKDTAWGFMGYSGIIEILRVLGIHKKFDYSAIRDILYRGLLLAIPCFFFIILSFAIHVIVLPLFGPGIIFVDFDFKFTLLDNYIMDAQLRTKRIASPMLLRRAVRVFYDQNRANNYIKSFHSSQSRPFNWPLLTGHAVDFWFSKGQISVLGNPIVNYLTFLSLFVTIFSVGKEKYYLCLRYVIGWMTCYFPFYLVPRTLYLYHYVLPLYVGCLNLGCCLELIFPKYYQGYAAAVIIFVGVIFFYHFCAFSYGFTDMNYKYLILNKAWEEGDSYYKSARDSYRN